jgi:exopolysaccharide biosynthesis polyprenyl glycosylphosphotransferase
LFSLHFFLTLIPRWTLTSHTVKKVHKREIGFNTIIIGSNQQAIDIYKELTEAFSSSGNKFVGFISLQKQDKYNLSEHIPNLGSIKDLVPVIEKYEVEEVIIALESSEHNQISHIINQLGLCNVIIKAIPDMYDILTGKVKMDHLFGTPLIQLSKDLMPSWQANLKQFIDICVSALALIILSPLLLVLAIGVKLSSKGPVFYSHERIGHYGKPFHIYKFRSMRTDAEKNGPELSSKEDNRLTNFGRFLRKYRLDEIPNFFNVLKGDMSLVGPRPERQFFIDQIIKKAPHYTHLHKVKPGITSWGQVKYGYAENVDQMVRRLRYDLLYIENMSLFVDFKILFYTVLTIIRGRGV